MVAKVFRVVVSGVLGGLVTFNNAFHIATDTPGIGPGLNASDVATAFKNALIQNPVGPVNHAWRNMVHTTNTFNTVTVNSLYPDGTEAGSAGIGLPGVTTTVPLPAPCAGIITWRTSRTGRSGRGRTYFGGMQYYTGVATAGVQVAPSASERTLLGNVATDFMNALGPSGTGLGAGWYLVVLSRKLAGSTPPINPAGVFPVTGWSVPNYWGTMGSRRGGHGI